MKENLAKIAEYLTEKAAIFLREAQLSKGELTLWTDAENLVNLLSFLRKDKECQFTQLIDITAVDYPERESRFEVVYHLLSIRKNRRIRVKLMAAEGMPVPSVVSQFSAAGWYERETWDMYGVPFAGNTDMRRILTDYGFSGHPLRKDFPLTGHVEVRYCEEQKKVVYEPVKLRQEFRNFDYLSPWEGPEKYILPGDEKAGVK